MGVSYQVTTNLEIPLPVGEKTIIAREGDFLYSFQGTPRTAQATVTPTSVSVVNGLLYCVFSSLPTIYLDEIVFLDSISNEGKVFSINEATNTVGISTKVATTTTVILPKASYLVEGERLVGSSKKIFVSGAGYIDVEVTNTSDVKKKD